MRTLFLGSPPFALSVLERLCASRHAPLALVTPPDRPAGRGRNVALSPLVELARARGLEALQVADPHGPSFLAELRARRPDVLVVASYGRILKRELLDLAPHGALNVHASLLPRWRGAAPIQAAILAGDVHTGVSIQRIVLALDEGDVLLSRRRAIGPEDTAGDLTAALAVLGGEALVEALDLLEAGRAVFAPQDPSQATYARKLRREAGNVDLARPAEELARLVRAMNPWPLARCLDPLGRELAILRAACAGRDGPAEPGQILETAPRFLVAAGRGALELREVCPAGKRAMSGPEFLRGARIQVGSRLEGLGGTGAPGAG